MKELKKELVNGLMPEHAVLSNVHKNGIVYKVDGKLTAKLLDGTLLCEGVDMCRLTETFIEYRKNGAEYRKELNIKKEIKTVVECAKKEDKIVSLEEMKKETKDLKERICELETKTEKLNKELIFEKQEAMNLFIENNS